MMCVRCERGDGSSDPGREKKRSKREGDCGTGVALLYDATFALALLDTIIGREGRDEEPGCGGGGSNDNDDHVLDESSRTGAARERRRRRFLYEERREQLEAALYGRGRFS